jgi:hypothetical protein
MKFLHSKFSRVFFVVYCVLVILAVIQDFTADKSFFDFSGLGLYLLSYPLIFLVKIFFSINSDSKSVLYLMLLVSSVIYIYLVDWISYKLQIARNKKSNKT